MERIFALYDSDVFYATRFMEYFRKKRDFNFNLSIFTRSETLIEFLKSNIIEILLISELMSVEDIPVDRIRHIYKLTEYPCINLNAELPSVFKYQAAQTVMTQIVNDYLKTMDESLDKNLTSRVKIISVFPMVQNSDAYTYTWSLCSLLAEQKRVLFVIMDPLPVPLFTEMNSSDVNLSEFIYYLKENPNVHTRMKALIKSTSNFSSLYGIAHGLDIISLCKEDIQKWVEDLRENSDYQIVIFYLGGYMEAGLELIRLSDTVSIPYRDTVYYREMHKALMKQLEVTGVDVTLNKFIKVKLQEEVEIDQLPITISDLSHTLAWSTVEQSMDVYL